MCKSLVFAVFVLLCDIRVIISKPASEQQQQLYLVRTDDHLNVEGLRKVPVPLKGLKDGAVEIPAKAVSVLLPESAAEDNEDTKKHYYLFKVREYYNFLPLYRDRYNRYSGLEIVDGGDMGDSSEEDLHKRVLAKRDISDFLRNVKRESIISMFKRDLGNKKSDIRDDTLKDSMNVLQTMFLRKRRDVLNNRPKRDLGNFVSDEESSADTDDTYNNNRFKYIAYVPFFRFRKYVVHRKLLDVNSY